MSWRRPRVRHPRAQIQEARAPGANGGKTSSHGGNGNGNGGTHAEPARRLTGLDDAAGESSRLKRTAADSAAQASSTLINAMKELQADAPACDVCGTITVRSGTCYKCLNCGNSMGCS